MEKIVSSACANKAPDDDRLDKAEERKLRKKVQNRLNQRARSGSKSSTTFLVLQNLS